MLAKIAIGIVATIGMTLGALFFFYGAGPWIEAGAIPMFGSRIYDTALFGAAGLLCIFITLRLIQGKVWAWWTTLWASILALGLGLSIFYSALHLTGPSFCTTVNERVYITTSSDNGATGGS